MIYLSTRQALKYINAFIRATKGELFYLTEKSSLEREDSYKEFGEFALYQELAWELENQKKKMKSELLLF